MSALTELESQTVATPAVGSAQSDITPSEKFDAAVNARDPKQAMVVAAENVGTPIGTAAVKAADLMLSGDRALREMTDPIEKAGGVNTPAGRIAASQQAQKYFKQDEPRFRDALVYWLTGNKQMAQAMITGGAVTKSIVTDNNGELIKVAKNQLGDIVDAEDVRGNKLTQEQYASRYVGRQKWEDTLSFQNQKQQQEANVAALKKSQAQTNAWAAVAPQLQEKYGQIYDDLGALRALNKGLGAKEFAEVQKFATSSLGRTSATSQGKTTFDQINANRATNTGQTLTKEQVNALGLGKENTAGWKFTNKGIETADGKQSFSYDELKNKTSTENSSKELTENYQQIRKDLIASTKFGQLNETEQNRLLRILENSYQVGQGQLSLTSTYGMPSFLVMPSAVEIEDQYGLGQAKAVQGLFSAKVMQLYGAYERKVLAESGNIAPDPNEIARGFANTVAYKRLLAESRQASENVLAPPPSLAPAPAAQPATLSVTVRPGAATAPTSPAQAPAIPAPAEAPAATAPAAPTVPAAPATPAAPARSRPAPRLPAGIPEGSVRTNRVTTDGKPLWRAPNGSLHTED